MDSLIEITDKLLFTASIAATFWVVLIASFNESWLEGIYGVKRFYCWIGLSSLSFMVLFISVYLLRPSTTCRVICDGLYGVTFASALNILYVGILYFICTKLIKDTDSINEKNLWLKNEYEKPYFRRVRELPPAFLSEFKPQLKQFAELGARAYPQYDQPEYVCRQLVCKCGEEKLELLVSKTKNRLLKRIYIGKKETEKPLVTVFCPTCEISNVVFDQRLHGWDAMFGHVENIEVSEPKKTHRRAPYRVYLGLSYYWLNSYERAVSENENIGIDLENYIDHHCCPVNWKIESLIS